MWQRNEPDVDVVIFEKGPWLFLLAFRGVVVKHMDSFGPWCRLVPRLKGNRLTIGPLLFTNLQMSPTIQTRIDEG